MMVYGTGRWAHFNVKLHFFLIGTEDEKQTSDKKDGPDLGPLSDFHHMILLRMLRPDRLPIVMSRYVSQHISLNIGGDRNLSLEQALTMSSSQQHAILIIMPCNKRMMTPCQEASPVEIVSSLAEVSIFESTFANGGRLV